MAGLAELLAQLNAQERDQLSAQMMQRGMRSQPSSPQDLSARVSQKFKGIAPYNLGVVDSRSKGDPMGFRKLEFYDPDQPDNPMPGRPTVEVFDPSFQGDALDNMIAADFLHYAGKNDPTVMKMREQFRQSMGPKEALLDRRAYDRARAGEFGYKEDRSYVDWLNESRLDQYLISQFLPPGPDRTDWMEDMAPQQLEILSGLERYLRTGKP